MFESDFNVSQIKLLFAIKFYLSLVNFYLNQAKFYLNQIYLFVLNQRILISEPTRLFNLLQKKFY